MVDPGVVHASVPAPAHPHPAVDGDAEDAALACFAPATRRWFSRSFGAATRVQREGWPAILAGEHTLMCAPTGSGKTLAAFLACLDRLARLPADAPEAVRVLYVSPLKALVYDVERNLRAPLAGILDAAADPELASAGLRRVRVDVRTGDTSSADRRRQRLHPADILVTTPESLALLLTSRAREALRQVDTVIVDEIHVMANSKRGVHLALALERLAVLTGREPQRIGLSATQNPLTTVAEYLGGDRPVRIVDASEAPRVALRVEMPAPAPADLEAAAPGEGGTWPALIARTLQLIRAHRSTIVFTNSRLLCERLAQRLNEAAGRKSGDELVLAHHGSISHERRRIIEERLKSGALPALIATSSMELGIDMGAVDLVVLIESPGSSARGLQRVGRAGHQVGAVSEGILLPKFRGDLLECAVVSQHMREGRVERLHAPRACLDVLAQHVVAMCSLEPWRVDELLRVVRRAAPYRELTLEVLASVLDMLSGRLPSAAFADLAPRISWDRDSDVLTGRRGAATLALMNAGTIPDRGLFSVFITGSDPGAGARRGRIGELDEEMVYESRVGDTVVLGASTWRIDEIGLDRVLVSPAPGESGRLPFWHGDRVGRPVELGRALGAFLREQAGRAPAEVARDLAAGGLVDERAAQELAQYLAEQQQATGALPTDRAITVESFRDEVGDWRVCLLSPFGGRVHAPWALAVGARLGRQLGWNIPVLWSDDGIALRVPESEEPPDAAVFFPDPEEVEGLVVDELRHSALFGARFRENAARALLLPRRRLRGRTPLWQQRKRSQALLAAAQQHPRFPIVLETYRECLQDVFDLPALTEVLDGVRQRTIRIDRAQTSRASPFAQSLVFQYVAAYLYDDDTPAAERRAQALTLDRSLLRRVLGHEEVRELIDRESLEELERELQHLEPERQARDADGVHDLLRRVGDLSDVELAARSQGSPEPWLAELARARRALRVRVAGEERWIAAEDGSRYRDALGVALPDELPPALLEPAPGALEDLVHRYARARGPFTVAELARRLGLLPAQLHATCALLVQQEVLVEGELRPGGSGSELCDAEVLRRLKRRSLARLRAEVAPVDGAAYARFLLSWQGVQQHPPQSAAARPLVSVGPRLHEVVRQLEGAPLPLATLESEILPARVPGFTPALLDQLGAMGGVAWVGRSATATPTATPTARGGQRGRARAGRSAQGSVALVRRERAPLLLPAAGPGAIPEELDGPARAMLAHLETRGASFLMELQRAAELRSPEETLTHLWSLAWRGLVTNDTFQPLRGLLKRPGARARGAPSVGGRWSLVRELAQGAPAASPTERAHALALTLLERWGVVSREACLAEELPGGFGAVYPVLRELEEAGHVRRGHFVEGLSGAQFALPGVVDRLRASRDGAGGAQVLSAADPANPWGAVLPWPLPGAAALDDDAEGRTAARPRRLAGARVVLVEGRPVLYLEPGGRSAVTLASAHDDSDDLARAVAALRAHLDYRTLRVARVDGGPAGAAPVAARLLAAGFQRDGVGLALSRQ